MSNLLASLQTAGHALDVYQQALDVVQNNITNAGTPGFATQSPKLLALPFNLSGGLIGGVAEKGLESARDEYAEEEVRRQVESLGRYETQVQGTSSVEQLFNVSGTSGIPADLDQLFQSFSAWSVTPNGPVAQQTVLSSAGQLGDDVRQLSASLTTTAQDIRTQIGSTVEQINQLAATIQQSNVQRLKETSLDPGLDANLHSSLEQLSELADISVVSQADGTVNILLSGGSPLVVGTTQYSLGASVGVLSTAVNPQAPPSAMIHDSQGNDITAQIQGGKLSGLLDVHNRVIASMIGDGNQTGSLNQFAKTLADTINGILQSGTTASGAAGTALFVYNSSDPTTAAGSLALNSSLTGSDLAAVDAQGNSNGNALNLAALADSQDSINGLSLGGFFAGIASFAGQESSSAQSNQQTQQQVVAQTRALRDQTSGVSLDAQAVALLQYQRSYQAGARLLTTINSLGDELMSLIK